MSRTYDEQVLFREVNRLRAIVRTNNREIAYLKILVLKLHQDISLLNRDDRMRIEEFESEVKGNDKKGS